MSGELGHEENGYISLRTAQLLGSLCLPYRGGIRRHIMKKYVFAHGGIFLREGKIVKRIGKGGISREFFRIKATGEEFPIANCKDELSDAEAKRFQKENARLSKAQEYLERIKNHEA